jgi:hypothetical protein
MSVSCVGAPPQACPKRVCIARLPLAPSGPWRAPRGAPTSVGSEPVALLHRAPPTGDRGHISAAELKL